LEKLVRFILHFSDAFENRMAVAILRLPDGLDYSKLTDDAEPHAYDNGGFSPTSSSQYLTGGDQSGFLRVDSNVSIAQLGNHPSDVSLSVIGKQQINGWHLGNHPSDVSLSVIGKQHLWPTGL
jgi:hypothetical protein